MGRSSTQVPEVSGNTVPLVNTTTPSVGDEIVFVTTERPSDDERMDSMTKLMMDDKANHTTEEEEDIITQFYPDYEYDSKEEDNDFEVIEEQRAIGTKVPRPKIKVLK